MTDGEFREAFRGKGLTLEQRDRFYQERHEALSEAEREAKPYGLQIIGWATGRPYGGARSGGQEWLAHAEFDVHAPGKPYPTGDGDSSPDPRHALRFANAGDALAFWRRESEVTPTRPDGKPNRPLTVFSMVAEKLPESEE